MSRRVLLRLSLALPGVLLPLPGLAQGIKLLEPINGVRQIPTGGRELSAFGYYVDLLFPWMIGVAGGIAVLWALFAGIQIMWSGGDQSKETAAKSQMLHAILGLLMIIFSAVILNMLNPSFFR